MKFSPDMKLVELQKDAMNPTLTVSNILRKVIIIASETGDEEFKIWGRTELKDYDRMSDVPDYRLQAVQLKARDPRTGRWIPLILPDELAEIAKIYSVYPFTHPITELESLLERGHEGGLVRLELTNEEYNLMLPIINIGPTQIALFVEISKFSLILSAVRDNVLEWSLEMKSYTENKTVTSPQANIEKKISELKAAIDKLTDPYELGSNHYHFREYVLRINNAHKKRYLLEKFVEETIPQHSEYLITELRQKVPIKEKEPTYPGSKGEAKIDDSNMGGLLAQELVSLWESNLEYQTQIKTSFYNIYKSHLQLGINTFESTIQEFLKEQHTKNKIQEDEDIITDEDEYEYELAKFLQNSFRSGKKSLVEENFPRRLYRNQFLFHLFSSRLEDLNFVKIKTTNLYGLDSFEIMYLFKSFDGYVETLKQRTKKIPHTKSAVQNNRVSPTAIVKALVRYFSLKELELLANEVLGEDKNAVGGSNAKDYAISLLEVVEKRSTIDNLLAAAKKDNKKFTLRIPIDQEKGVYSNWYIPWQGSMPTKEAITGDEITFRSIPFLEEAIRTSQSVGKITTHSGNLGTGFLISENHISVPFFNIR